MSRIPERVREVTVDNTVLTTQSMDVRFHLAEMLKYK